MPRPSSLACVRCNAHYPLDHYVRACAACAAQNIASNLTVCYDSAPGGGRTRGEVAAQPRSQWRWDMFLPATAADAVTLGEGDTPLLATPALGLGDVWIKDESRNPTWSFKDRLASSAVTMGRIVGAKLIASSSSGNAGASAAAYAAKAGLPCIVFTFKGAAGPLLTQMRAYGAMVVVVEDKGDRWRLQSAGVKELGWYSTSPFFGPVIGSNPYGMEGYKTIAYEIAEAFDWEPPDWCVLPVCYGDALYGMWKGFEELKAIGWIDRVPRFAAAEVSGSLTAALSAGDAMPMPRPRNAATIATSIGANQCTVQALEVLGIQACTVFSLSGGGAAGLELATRLGNTVGRRKASVTLLDKSRLHVWKPLLHEIAQVRSTANRIHSNSSRMLAGMDTATALEQCRD
jgi:threonine synthase